MAFCASLATVIPLCWLNACGGESQRAGKSGSLDSTTATGSTGRSNNADSSIGAGAATSSAAGASLNDSGSSTSTSTAQPASSAGGPGSTGSDEAAVTTTSAEGGSAGASEGTTASVGGGAGSSNCGCQPSDLQCAMRCASSRQTSGDCKGDDHCNGGRCIELSLGGFRVCTQGPIEAPGCMSEGSQADECCSSDECDTGLCVMGPGPTYCGGPVIEPYHYCASDECQSADDCSHLENGVCFPAGSYGYPVATCAAGACRKDADCNAEPEGRCALIKAPCCATYSLACVYEDGCRTLADCPEESRSCLIQEGRTECSPETPVCPA